MKKLLGIGLVAVLGSGAVSAATKSANCVKLFNEEAGVKAVICGDQLDTRYASRALKALMADENLYVSEDDGGDLGVMGITTPSLKKPVRGGNSTGGGTTTPTLPTVEPGGGTIPVSFPPKTNPNDPNSGGSGGF
ncbi:MAG: hypothetical protein LW817_06650 [Candidatus Caenarcaniphilales bacterium]|jgi:hypothetical protein|nr:hypothetical protein [Candidatus Caenarcaniphilales bacterium]